MDDKLFSYHVDCQLLKKPTKDCTAWEHCCVMLHSNDGVYNNAMLSMAKKINIYKSHSLNELYSLIPSGRRFKVVQPFTDSSGTHLYFCQSINIMIIWILLPVILTNIIMLYMIHFRLNVLWDKFHLLTNSYIIIPCHLCSFCWTQF